MATILKFKMAGIKPNSRYFQGEGSSSQFKFTSVSQSLVYREINNIKPDFSLDVLGYDSYYSCGLSTTTIEYSCPSACLRVFPSFRLCVCLCTR